jgi:Holliday junction resolvase
MATTFETQLVHAFQNYFIENNIKAIAYRYRQLLWCGQFADIAVDSASNEYYLGVECKSIQTKKLYFGKVHFQENQVQRLTEFLDISGRKGYLGLEFRHRGMKSEGYLIPWTFVKEVYDTGEKGIVKDDFVGVDGVVHLERGKNVYVIPMLPC